MNSIKYSLSPAKTKNPLQLLCLAILTFSGAAQPVISSLSSQIAEAGSTITISGSGFSSTPSGNMVRIGNAAATVSSASSSELRVIVPPGGVYVPVSVTVDGRTAFSAQPLTLGFSSEKKVKADSFARVDLIEGGFTDVVAADFDNDGRLEIAVLVADPPAVRIYKVNGTGVNMTLNLAQSVDVVSSACLATGDFDGDGRLDIVCTGLIVTLLHNGELAWAKAAEWDFRTGPAKVADFNGDGRLDFAVQSFSDEQDGYGLRLFQNVRLGGTLDASSFSSKPYGSGRSELAIVDADRDGWPDLAVSKGLMLNQKNGSEISFGLPIQISSIPITGLERGQFGDFDNNGSSDLAITREKQVRIYQNLSSPGRLGFWPDAVILTTGDAPIHLTVNDLDGDGKMDLIAGSGVRLNIWDNENTDAGLDVGDFLHVEIGMSGIGKILPADLDGDGRTDMIGLSPGIVAFSNQMPLWTPVITTQPNQVVNTELGADVTLAVVAAGEELTYQWFYNQDPTIGQPIAGATSSSYLIANGDSADTGYYYVEVTNPHGTDRSMRADVRFEPSIIISAQPSDQNLTSQQRLELVFVATSESPLQYQWYHNGNPIAGATQSTFVIPNAGIVDAGDYWVVIDAPVLQKQSRTARVNISTIPNRAPGVLSAADEPNLREAIATASGPMLIEASGRVKLQDPINITGNTILDATGHELAIENVAGGRIFEVQTGASLSLTGVTLANGSLTGSPGAETQTGESVRAGAILNAGDLFMKNCVVSNFVILAGEGNGMGPSSEMGRPTAGGDAEGGAIYSSGFARLEDCEFYDCQALAGKGGSGISLGNFGGSGGAAEGGAIWSSGILRILNCRFERNAAIGGPTGNSVYRVGLDGNAAGGAVFQGQSVSANPVDLQVQGSVFADNRITGGSLDGGALFTQAPVEISDSKFYKNQLFCRTGSRSGRGKPSRGGAVSSTANAVVRRSSFENNLIANGDPSLGGGLYCAASLEMTASTIASNRVAGTLGYYFNFSENIKIGVGQGGGLALAGRGALTNCTIAHNVSVGGECEYSDLSGSRGGDGAGGGIDFNGEALDLNSVTIVRNSAKGGTSQYSGLGKGSGGAISVKAGTIRIVNTLLAGNSVEGLNSTLSTISGSVTDLGHNLATDSTFPVTTGASRIISDAKLGTFENHGGLTWTYSLLPDSPAIDAADSVSGPRVDQREVTRPAGMGPDIGAFEADAQFRLALRTSPTPSVQWFGESGKNYQAQKSNDLKNWEDIGAPQAGEDGVISVPAAFSTGPEFYRVISTPR